MPNASRPAVFLDRDGTIIVDAGYLRRADQVCFLAGAGEALAKIKTHGFALVLISNQSGIGRGLITAAEAELVHQAVVARLAEYGVRLDGVFYCPHTPADQCRCRKPSPEMLRQAAKELDLDLTRSFMIGDKASDIEAGKRAGCRTILLVPGDSESGLPFSKDQARTDFVARHWTEVLQHLLGRQGMVT